MLLGLYQGCQFEIHRRPKKKCNQRDCASSCSGTAGISPADPWWHLKRGWIGAGYNILVRKDGSVWELRPLWAVGAHAQGQILTVSGIAPGMYHPSGVRL